MRRKAPDFIKRLQKDEQFVLKELMELQFLFYKACKMLQNKADVNIVVSETMFDVWNKRSTFTDEEHLLAHIRTVLHNKTVDLLKSRAKYALYGAFPEDFPFDMDTNEIEITETESVIKKWMDTVMNKLPPKRRKVVELLRKQYTDEEVAAELKMSVNNVQTHKYHAVKDFKELIERMSDDEKRKWGFFFLLWIMVFYFF